MKRNLLSLVLIGFVLNGFGQKLFVPGGFTSSGIGTSANSTNVGIGISNPQWGLLQLNASADNVTA